MKNGMMLGQYAERERLKARTRESLKRRCPRCGKKHVFKMERIDNPVYPYWAICPETGKPVLFHEPDGRGE